MNQQQIFENMIKGEWKPLMAKYKDYNGIDADVTVLCTSEDSCIEDYDIHAICSAVNNTYGKGINPESVEKMRGALEQILKLHDDGRLDTISVVAGPIAQQALTAAKL
jgi:hypothetical protein